MAAHRSQASFLVALQRDDPREAAVAAAMSLVDFCEQHPPDAQLLVAFRREDLMRAIPEGPLAEEVETLNRPVKRAVVQLARRLYGSGSRAALDRTLLAVFDLPYGARAAVPDHRRPAAFAFAERCEPRCIRGDRRSAVARWAAIRPPSAPAPR